MEQGGQGLFKIGDLAQKAGVTVRTIRYYEELGLLAPTETSPGGFRLYSEKDLHRLHFVKRFKELDFPLEEIVELINLSDAGQTKTQKIESGLSVLQKQLEQVNSKIEQLLTIKEDITQAINLVHECNQCREQECPEECPNRKALV